MATYLIHKSAARATGYSYFWLSLMTAWMTVCLLCICGCKRGPTQTEAPPPPPPAENTALVPDRPHLLQYQQSHTSLPLNKLFFLDDQQGWAAGRDGVIIHTADGGENWQPQSSGTDDHLIDITFVNQNVGWAMSVHRLLTTKDGGRNWEDIWDTSTIELNDSTDQAADDSVEFQAALTAVAFADPRKGYALALGWDPSKSQYVVPLALTTSDGGDSWDWHVLDGAYGTLAAVNNKVCILGGKFGHIAQTTDGGATWEKRNSLTEDDLLSINFPGPQLGWAVGSQGTIINSNDGGRTWSAAYRPVQTEKPIELHALHFNGLQGVAAGFVDLSKNDKQAYLLTLLTTSDGGRNWQRQEVSGAYFPINSMSVINPQAVWAAGGGGQILKFKSAE